MPDRDEPGGAPTVRHPPQDRLDDRRGNIHEGRHQPDLPIGEVEPVRNQGKDHRKDVHRGVHHRVAETASVRTGLRTVFRPGKRRSATRGPIAPATGVPSRTGRPGRSPGPVTCHDCPGSLHCHRRDNNLSPARRSGGYPSLPRPRPVSVWRLRRVTRGARRDPAPRRVTAFRRRGVPSGAVGIPDSIARPGPRRRANGSTRACGKARAPGHTSTSAGGTSRSRAFSPMTRVREQFPQRVRARRTAAAGVRQVERPAHL